MWRLGFEQPTASDHEERFLCNSLEDFLEVRGGRPVQLLEANRFVGVDEDPVRQDGVVMEVQIEAGAKPLREGHRTDVRLLQALASGLPALPAKYLAQEDAGGLGRRGRIAADLALTIGYLSQTPESTTGRGPDVLWSLGRQKFYVIECKNGATVDTIAKDYCNQLTGSMAWFAEKYGPTCIATPIMVHPASTIEYAATMHPNARVITTPHLDALRTAFREFAKAVAAKPRYGTETEVAQLLSNFKLTEEVFVSEFSVKPRAAKK